MRTEIEYFCQYTINIIHHFIIPKSYYRKSLRFQPIIPSNIVFFIFYVLTTVEFYNQLIFKTHKINNI